VSRPNARAQESLGSERTYNVLARMLLRHYAKNRRRSWRNGPHDAFLDARIQMESPLACFIMGPFALIYLVLSRTAMPWLAQAAFDKITKGGAIVALLSIAIFIFIDMSFGRYESIAEVETRFDSKADRKLVNLYFVGGLSALAVILFAAHFIKLSLPSSP
jgi:quinol-cytochrome oxidoreductase complex cytochrome b subunit